MKKRCDISSMTIGTCDLEWGHSGDMHANSGDGFYAPQFNGLHQRRQLERYETLKNRRAKRIAR